MGGKPKIIRQDPEADAKKAAEEAAIKTNAKIAQRNKTRSRSVLSSAENSFKKTTLGGG